jgi:hypothetical protein
MTFNSQEIIQDIYAEFERLLDFVTGNQARTAKADHIERGLFKRVRLKQFDMSITKIGWEVLSSSKLIRLVPVFHAHGLFVAEQR